jgi:hypothetical protein
MDVISFHDMNRHKNVDFGAGVAEGVWQVNLGWGRAAILTEHGSLNPALRG